MTCNIISGPDSNNNEMETSSSPAPSLRETGVKRLLLLAVVPDATEGYDIMSEVLKHVRLQDIGGLIIAADLKMANILCGLQVSFTNHIYFTLYRISREACIYCLNKYLLGCLTLVFAFNNNKLFPIAFHVDLLKWHA